MYGIDSVNHQARPNLIYVEGGGSAFRIAPEQGKALNLREGQIINGTIALRPEGNAIKISGQYLPPRARRQAIGWSSSIYPRGHMF